ncbi:MAG: hypothetical protein AABY50_02160 [Nitrospirota bacterium]
MQLIHCTKKLQKEMGLSSSGLTNEEPENSFLGSWHANLISIDRRKCVLFANDKTLFNFLIPDVTRAQLREMDKLFLLFLSCVLSDEGFEQKVKDKILEEYREIGYANTNNRNVLGSMNDLAYHYKYHILDEGGLYSAAVPDIIRRLNRMPMSAIGYKYSIDAIRQFYGIADK